LVQRNFSTTKCRLLSASTSFQAEAWGTRITPGDVGEWLTAEGSCAAQPLGLPTPDPSLSQW